MLYRSTVILSFILMLGCGGANYDSEDSLKAYKISKRIGLDKLSMDMHYIAPQFRKYVRNFEKAYGGSIGDIGVDFGKSSAFASMFLLPAFCLHILLVFPKLYFLSI